MADMHTHERIYRSDKIMSLLSKKLVTICGAGAVGGNLAEHLARIGFKNLRVIDFDRIEEHNVSTQPYSRDDIGSFKAKILATQLYRSTQAKVEAIAERLTAANIAKLVGRADVLIDAFDNTESRKVVQDYASDRLPCLHVGLAADYAEIVWDERYSVPKQTGPDICEYALARNTIMLAVAIASESLIRFIEDGTKKSYAVTLRDFAIRAF